MASKPKKLSSFLLFRYDNVRKPHGVVGYEMTNETYLPPAFSMASITEDVVSNSESVIPSGAFGP